jgi:hypothetical protein
MIGDNGIERDE